MTRNNPIERSHLSQVSDHISIERNPAGNSEVGASLVHQCIFLFIFSISKFDKLAV